MSMAPRIQHPWEIFLAARANAIDWLRKEFGDTDAEIAGKLSMDTMQVYLIRTRDRDFDHVTADQQSEGDQ